MNRLIAFMFISAMFFGLNEACKKNIVMISNQLYSSRGNLLIECSDNKGKFSSNLLSFDASPFIISFSDYRWPKETRWDCTISHGENNKFYYDLQVYHANFQRCGQFRSWIAKDDGIWFTESYEDPAGFVLPWKTRT
ncbi:unnamed protein product [Brassica rapa]|uniref:S-protein homolog n=1 Tax=Brassica campestris TaxID=3711 RepID=A0A8D9D2D6_BRACM|nr:unnamed protein product [Brassica rapa]